MYEYWTWLNGNSAGITALATVVLMLLTGAYVILTGKLARTPLQIHNKERENQRDNLKTLFFGELQYVFLVTNSDVSNRPIELPNTLLENAAALSFSSGDLMALQTVRFGVDRLNSLLRVWLLIASPLEPQRAAVAEEWQKEAKRVSQILDPILRSLTETMSAPELKASRPHGKSVLKQP